MISPLAYIDSNAQIGADVKIHPFAVIHRNVIIDDGAEIFSNAVIMDGARIGKNCKIFPGAVIAAIPQDLKFDGEESLVEIGDHTTIRECVTINRGTQESGTTKIGTNTLIMAYVHIAHDCRIGNNCILANAVNLAGHVEVGDYSVLGGMVGVHQFVKIGKHSMVSGGTLVGKDIPPYVTAGRNPVAYVGLNSIGLKRRAFSMEDINSIASIYKILYTQGLIVSNAIKKIEETIPESNYKSEILDFLLDAYTNRGIIKSVQEK